MKRKTPIKHRVHTHIRNGKHIQSYNRGKKRNTVKLADPTIHHVPSETYFPELFDLQNQLIEHKYPIPGVWEHILTHAGDIFRGITRGKSNSAYIMEKLGRLKRYIEDPINKADFEDFRYYSDGEYYRKNKYRGGSIEEYSPKAIKLKKENYIKNLSILKKETQNTKMNPKRKEAMLNALDITKTFFNYFEKKWYDVPYEDFNKLEKSVKTYLGEEN